MIEKVASMAGKRGYNVSSRLDNCLIMSKCIKDIVKVLIIYEDKVIVQEIVDLKQSRKVAELSSDQISEMLKGE